MEEVQTTHYNIGIPNNFSIFCFHIFLLLAEHLSYAWHSSGLRILHFACHPLIVGMGMWRDLPSEWFFLHWFDVFWSYYGEFLHCIDHSQGYSCRKSFKVYVFKNNIDLMDSLGLLLLVPSSWWPFWVFCGLGKWNTNWP